MNNFLYCFDSNYNIPGTCSIYSLLENTSEKINIYIMHKDFDSPDSFPDKIKKHKMLASLKVIKVELDNYDFPNIQGTHISEATYYRLFIEDYLSDEINFITYLDCDVFSINNPLKLINKNIEEMKRNDSIISVTQEKSMINYGIKNLNMKSKRYFNAGVMIIDLNKWKSCELKNNFLKIISNMNKKLLYWDQDVLNLSFDGDYSELHNYLNYKVDMEENDLSIETSIKKGNDISLLHYSGKFKPWAIKGAIHKNAEYFQNIYRNLYGRKYYISYNYRLNAIRDLIRGVLSGALYRTKFPFSFIFISLKSIVKK
tara:strand:- start:539 stop:1480 length:942 start_codon:yes stop_codon:yes gene_type:complete